MVKGTELEPAAVVVVNSKVDVVVLDSGVTGHGLNCVSTLQDRLQYAT